MEPQTTSVKTIAPLRNVALFSSIVERVTNRHEDLPGMATFYGASGAGKSSASIYAKNRSRAYCIEAKSVWTRRHTCRMILAELGVMKPTGSIPEMVDLIGQELSATKRPLIIDDAQLLFESAATARMIRDIYKSSAGAPILLIGEPELLAQLKKIENIDSLMLVTEAALPANLADAKHLARLYCPNVQIADEVLSRIIDAVKGSIRRVCKRLDDIREHAATAGLKSVAATDLPAAILAAGGR